MELTLDHILQKWESAEFSVEEKISGLEKYVFEHLGFKHEPNYYRTKGSLFRRYCAGFIDRYFTLLRDISFILLDPLHIFDIVTAFVKGIFTHPIKSLNQIWKVWTKDYRRGVFGLGALTADALLAALIAGASTALVEDEIGMAGKSAVQGFNKKIVGSLTKSAKKVVETGEVVVETINSSNDFFAMLKANPLAVIADAKQSMEDNISYGKIRSYKLYAKNYLANKKV